jgi:CRISPR-associated protein Cas2
MVLVLAYDVVDDTRRAKLFKRMKGFLTPVQKSVFEGDLPARRWNELVRTVSAIIDASEDSVRIYSICRACKGSTTLLGTSPPVADPAEPILV